MVGIIKEISVWKTIKFNFHYFPLVEAFKFPVLVGRNIKVEKLGNRGDIEINTKKTFGVVKLGLTNESFKKCVGVGYWHQEPGGKVIFNGDCILMKDSKIHVSNTGILIFGNNFSSNSNVLISCGKHIEFGEDNLLGWNVTIIDGDGHDIMDKDGNVINKCREIVLGEHVWLSSGVTILKGSFVPSGCVIGANSTVSKKYNDENALIVGSPAKTVKYDISWKH